MLDYSVMLGNKDKAYLVSELAQALKTLNHIYNFWENKGDAESRYSHEVRALIRRNGGKLMGDIRHIT